MVGKGVPVLIVLKQVAFVISAKKIVIAKKRKLKKMKPLLLSFFYECRWEKN